MRKSRIEVQKKSIEEWEVPGEVRREVLQFLDDLSLGKVNRGKRVGEGAQLKYFHMLHISLEFFNKPTATIVVSDVERFEKALIADKIRTRHKQRPYSSATKAAMRKSLRVFLRWRLGEAKGVELAGWLDTRAIAKTPDYLSETEVERLYKHCWTAEQRFAVAVLFDSGSRAEEFLNIRFEDIHLPDAKENFVRLTLKAEYSKTLGRSISLFWRHSLETVREYVQERSREGVKPHDQMLKMTYDALRMTLARLGKNVLKRSVYPHLFRHSSATYYATKLNRQELCYRYGWRFSSNMPDVYISRSGMENRELDEKFTATELGLLKDELAQKEQADKIKDDRIRQLETIVAIMQRDHRKIAKALALNPTVEDVEAALERKRATRLQSTSVLWRI